MLNMIKESFKMMLSMSNFYAAVSLIERNDTRILHPFYRGKYFLPSKLGQGEDQMLNTHRYAGSKGKENRLVNPTSRLSLEVFLYGRYEHVLNILVKRCWSCLSYSSEAVLHSGAYWVTAL